MKGGTAEGKPQERRSEAVGLGGNERGEEEKIGYARKTELVGGEEEIRTRRTRGD